MKNYIIRDREAGNEIARFETMEEAQAELNKYEAADKAEGSYSEDFYEIITEEEKYIVCERTTEVKTRLDSDETLTVEELNAKADAVMDRRCDFSPDGTYEFESYEEALKKFEELKNADTSFYQTSNKLLYVYQVYIEKAIYDEDGYEEGFEVVDFWTSEEIRRGA